MHRFDWAQLLAAGAEFLAAGMDNNRWRSQIVRCFLGCIGDQFSWIQYPFRIKQLFDSATDRVEFAELLPQIGASTQANCVFAGNHTSVFDDFFENAICDSLHLGDIVWRMRIQKRP